MKTFDYLLLGAFVIFIIMVTNFFVIITKDSTACYQNPPEYMVKKFEQLTNTSVSCVCSFYNPKYLPLFITSNGTSVYEPLVPKQNDTIIYVNFSDWKFG